MSLLHGHRSPFHFFQGASGASRWGGVRAHKRSSKNCQMPRCQSCGTEIEPSRHGRPRKYCNERCRSRARRSQGKVLSFTQSQPSSQVRKPAFVKGPAAQIWKRTAPKLIHRGVLTPIDVEMFGAWCCLMAEFAEDPAGFSAARLAQLRGLGKSFGLTPGGRRGIRAEPPQKPGPDELKYFSPT